MFHVERISGSKDTDSRKTGYVALAVLAMMERSFCVGALKSSALHAVVYLLAHLFFPRYMQFCLDGLPPCLVYPINARDRGWRAVRWGFELELKLGELIREIWKIGLYTHNWIENNGGVRS